MENLKRLICPQSVPRSSVLGCCLTKGMQASFLLVVRICWWSTSHTVEEGRQALVSAVSFSIQGEGGDRKEGIQRDEGRILTSSCR